MQRNAGSIGASQARAGAEGKYRERQAHRSFHRIPPGFTMPATLITSYAGQLCAACFLALGFGRFPHCETFAAPAL
jgi:hypothetical protein